VHWNHSGNAGSKSIRTEDRGRRAYGRNREAQPRTCIFIGTTNDSHYLKDSSGNRRFWPVKIGQVDLQGLKRDRDQLWAEAVVREADDEHIHLEPELYAAAAEAQEQRLMIDPWEDVLSEVKGTPCGAQYRVHSNTLLAELGLEVGRSAHHEAKRIAAIMKRHGWNGPAPVRIGDKHRRGFWRPA
jgi:predicted P-loop ATPase